MQAPFSCVPSTYQDIETAISPARLRRFLPSANGDKHLALRLYVWNARLCEEFYLPIQTAEVLIRNRIADALKTRYGLGWYSNAGVHAIIPEKHRRELNALVLREQIERGAAFTGDHVVSGLSFGFWANWLTASYTHHIWQAGIRQAFPYSPPTTDREQTYRRVDRLRKFRNLVMHHRAIFDRKPIAEYQNIAEVVSWISPGTIWLLHQLSSPARMINARPRL